MARSADDCCSLEGVLPDSLDDPTLSSCCRKDLLDQRRDARLFDKLSLADRSSVRTSIGRAAYLSTPPAEPSGFSARSSLTSDDEDDCALQQLRDSRLQQLKQAAQQHSQLWSAGHGCLTDMKEAAALDEIRQQNGTTILHLSEVGDLVAQEMDELLSSLAALYVHTRFARVPLNRTSRLPPEVGLPHAPALLCFRDGSIIGKATIRQFQAGGNLLEEKVTKWLRSKGSLRASPATQAAGEEDGSERDDDAQEAESDWIQPCEVCGRRYHHEHVRAVYGHPEGSDDDSK